MLKVSNINSFYERIQVLWDINFHIEEKEIVAFLGVNGAGKSSLLDVISGLHSPASGSVEFLGQRIEKKKPQEIISHGIAYVPEGRRLFLDMTVRENLELGAYLTRAWKKKEERIERIYQVFPILKEREKYLAKTLSGGEQQMLSIGRGIMTEPKLCMIDEASYGLSPLMARNIFDNLNTLRKHGTTILLIEQNVKAALSIADRAYVLENGRIVLEGKSEEMLRNDHVKAAYLGF